MPSHLWIVATPLGNVEDFSPRARVALTEADLVLAEDTRRAGLLCQRAGISAKGFLSFHEHNEQARIPELISLLQAEKNLALISDAGTPLIADPGFRLVQACRAHQIKVSVIPGPCAAITALAGSGIAPQPFIFLGFLPRNSAEQKTLFQNYVALNITLIFYERKDRLVKTLKTACEILGDREFCIARELTKTHEEYLWGNLADPSPFENLLGEITVVIGPGQDFKTPLEDLHIMIQAELDSLPPKLLAKNISQQVKGYSPKEIYQLILQARSM